jgi:mono/diheme cytochrome c family protein
MIKNSVIFVAATFLCCGCSKKAADEAAKNAPNVREIIAQQPHAHGPAIKDVEVKNPLDAAWVDAGKTIYETKCLPCHKLTEDKLVGPGWSGVTKRRKPVWIINMISNTDMMLTEDAEAQKLLEMCLVRMPNQNVTVEDSRKILEFMRKNDGEN